MSIPVSAHSHYFTDKKDLSIVQNDVKASDIIAQSRGGVEGQEHRLKLIRTTKGVRFIDDAYATNVNATWFTLESLEENASIIWLAGGIIKRDDCYIIESLVRERVKAIICFGGSRYRYVFQQLFTKHVNAIFSITDIKDAVQTAQRLACSGDTVLLSPACGGLHYDKKAGEFIQAVNEL